MKSVGRYTTECDYDLDHEISNTISKLRKLMGNIESDSDIENTISILRAMKEEIEEKLYMSYFVLAKK